MNAISKCPIFIGLENEEIFQLLDNKCRIRQYSTGDIIVFQGDKYQSLLIVSSGIVRGEMTNVAGDRMVIEEIGYPRAIAPAILFASDNRLPVDVVALTEVEIISIKRYDLTEILQRDIRVLQNFIRSISDRSKFLSDRVRLLRFGTIKSKLASYLVEQMQAHRSPSFTISHTHQDLADMFGVTRPALSRAIGQLAEDGAIISDKNTYNIINQKKLINLIK